MSKDAVPVQNKSEILSTGKLVGGAKARARWEPRKTTGNAFRNVMFFPSISPSDHLAWQVGKEAIVLAKKTGSTDNLTGHLGTAKSTDCLIKEVP